MNEKLSLSFLSARNSSPHLIRCLCMTVQSIVVSSKSSVIAGIARAVTETTTVELSLLRDLFFLRRKLANLGSRECSQKSAGSASCSGSEIFGIIALLFTATFHSVEYSISQPLSASV